MLAANNSERLPVFYYNIIQNEIFYIQKRFFSSSALSISCLYLFRNQLSVHAPLGYKVFVAPLFYDLAMFKDKNAIGILDRTQAMCNDDDRHSPLGDHVIYSALHQLFRVTIQRRSCLIYKTKGRDI